MSLNPAADRLVRPYTHAHTHPCLSYPLLMSRESLNPASNSPYSLRLSHLVLPCSRRLCPSYVGVAQGGCRKPIFCGHDVPHAVKKTSVRYTSLLHPSFLDSLVYQIWAPAGVGGWMVQRCAAGTASGFLCHSSYNIDRYPSHVLLFQYYTYTDFTLYI